MKNTRSQSLLTTETRRARRKHLLLLGVLRASVVLLLLSCSLHAATKNLVPNATGDGGLGTAAKQWREVNASTGAFSSKLTLGGEPVATTNQAGVIAASVAAAAVAANTNFPNGVSLIAPLAFGDPGFDGWLIQFDNSDVHLPLVWTNPIAGWFTTARDLPQSIATWQDISNNIPDLSGYAPLANPTLTWPDPEESGFGIRLENTTGDSVRFAGYDTEPGSTPGSVRISRTGDVTASGMVAASGFVGDGSGLTGLPFATRQEVTNCVEAAVLGSGSFTTNSSYALAGSLGTAGDLAAGGVVRAGGTNLYAALVGGTNDTYAYVRATAQSSTNPVPGWIANQGGALLQAATNYTDAAQTRGLTNVAHAASLTVDCSRNVTLFVTNATSGHVNLLLTNCSPGTSGTLRFKPASTVTLNWFSGASLTCLVTNNVTGYWPATNMLAAANKVLLACYQVGLERPDKTNVVWWAVSQP